MIEPHCIGPDVDIAKISPNATISGASYLTGAKTSVGPGALVRDVRLHNTLVEGGTSIFDSIIVAEGEPKSHCCDAAGKVVVTGTEQPRVATGAEVVGSTLINVLVERGTRICESWAKDCRFGRDNTIEKAKLTMVNTAWLVKVSGPTEVSEAYLGDGAVIDRCGYFEGVFSNKFHRLSYNKREKILEIIYTVALPHISRYGTNTIVSTNSGKLMPQPDGIVRGFGNYGGLWHDPLLSHEQVEFAPCCWVAPYTKVVGQSADAHLSDEQLVNDKLTTYVMPFAMAGVYGDITRGLVMPGELSIGLGYKQRRGAWVFTYAPGAVIDMVGRLHDALEPDRKKEADTIVVESLWTALAMVEAMADINEVDLSLSTDLQKKVGRARWIVATYNLLNTHLNAELWRFEGGRPCEWRKEGDRWVHPRFERVLALSPDALEKQTSEAEIFGMEDNLPPTSTVVPTGAVQGSGKQPQIDPNAFVSPDAFIGPGCRIGANTIIEAGTSIWNSDLTGCRIKQNTQIQRSRLKNTQIGSSSIVRSCIIEDSQIGEHVSADAARVTKANFADQVTVGPFGDIVDVKTAYGVILGGCFKSSGIDTYLMSMHMAGDCAYLQSVPSTFWLHGRQVIIPAIPMLGAGASIRGTADAPVRMEGCFIGSNAVLEAGVYVGFGSFVQGHLNQNVSLLPFTIGEGDLHRHKIGGVLVSLPNIIITHFINWTFQAVGSEQAAEVAELTKHAIKYGIEAVEWELARRAGQKPTGDEKFVCYRSLGDYPEQQLHAGLFNYRRALDSGAWDIECRDGQLWFCSSKGRWLERSGSAFWEKV